MSSLRKLQQEIDKTLKKVQEGLEVFDDHQEQYDTTDPGNTNAREKLESQVRCWALRQPGGSAEQRRATAGRQRGTRLCLLKQGCMQVSSAPVASAPVEPR